MLALTINAVAPEARADNPNPFVELVDAAAQRLQTAEPVAAVKWQSGAAIDDAARVRQVLDAVSADATSAGIDPDHVRAVFADQINATDAIEYARFSEWKLDPASAPAQAPELSASRAAIDALNHTMVSQLALHRDSLQSPTCAADLDDAVNLAVTARQLDGLYRRALSFATRSYCR
jgi:chorismate mutase